jgi:apolipoprotein N-acyltransferase
LLLAAGWGVCEFARANLLIGNPWALAGYSQVALTRLMQIADATGPYGVGMLIAAVNACLAGFFAPALRGRRLTVSCVGVIVALGVTLVYGGWRLAQIFATGEPIKAAVIQGAIERKFRQDPKYRVMNLNRYLTLTKEAAAAHPDLIFWPEYALDFYLRKDSPEREAVLGITRDMEADLILGGPHYSYGVSHIEYHNSVFLVRKGTLAGHYDKLRLLPFAEENQLAWLFPHLRNNYEPGRHLHALRTRAAQVGTFVCFEAMYPELVRGFVQQGAEVLANPANDDWFGYAAPARHQLDIATVRAIENRRYLVRPTATGFSAIIDPYGRAIALSGFGSPAVLTASVRPSRTQTPYQRWGDMAIGVAVAFATLSTLYRVDWLQHKLCRRCAMRPG